MILQNLIVSAASHAGKRPDKQATGHPERHCLAGLWGRRMRRSCTKYQIAWVYPPVARRYYECALTLFVVGNGKSSTPEESHKKQTLASLWLVLDFGEES